MKQINKSRKVLNGFNRNEINDPNIDKRISGKYGLSDIMGNMLDKEYLRVKKKKENIIKIVCYGDIGKELVKIIFYKR